MMKMITYIFGVLLLLAGILGFIPAATPDSVLFGYFHVNTIHNIVHLVTGAIALWVASGCANCGKCLSPKLFFKIFGVIYGIVAILGFWHGNAPIFGVLANNLADSILHTVIALVSLYLGFFYKRY